MRGCKTRLTPASPGNGLASGSFSPARPELPPPTWALFPGSVAPSASPGQWTARDPGQNSACPFLVFEDFGTTGLEGDPTQWHPMEGFRNGFFTFFRGGPLG